MDHVFPSNISLREQDRSPCHPCLTHTSKHTASIDVRIQNTLLFRVARVVQAFLWFRVYRGFLVSPSGLAVLGHNPDVLKNNNNNNIKINGSQTAKRKKINETDNWQSLKLKAPLKHKFWGYFSIEKSRNGQREILLFTENYNGNFLRVLTRFKLNENAITEKKRKPHTSRLLLLP